jgi:CHAT domain-containing protein
MNNTLKDFNLHIEKASGKNFFVASVRDENNSVIATNGFQYEPSASILTMLEDTMGANVKENVKQIRKFGSSLFSSVFQGPVLDCFQSQCDDNIRLRLFFQKEQSELLRMPWEFMFDGRHFLAASPKMTVTRALEGLSCAKKKPVGRKLRVLGVISSPLDLPGSHRLQTGKERMLIHQAFDSAYVSDRIEIDFLDRASIRNINEAFDKEEYHILHFTGHGIYSRQERTCYLLLEDDFGGAMRVDNDTVADLLSRHQSLRLVVLSGCQTALSVGHRVIGSLPTPLLAKNIPAVIAMQYSVTDRSALDLARTFYAGIGEGLPLDLALTNARRALLASRNEGMVDFGTPVLYGEPDCLNPKY